MMAGSIESLKAEKRGRLTSRAPFLRHLRAATRISRSRGVKLGLDLAFAAASAMSSRIELWTKKSDGKELQTGQWDLSSMSR